jgi:AcrR family transcriptional regulator
MSMAVGSRDVRNRLLDAAASCFRRFGIAQTTMDDVIRAARIPRTTAYRHVGAKGDLIAAVVLREITTFLERLAVELAGMEPIEEALVEGVLRSIEECHQNELLAKSLGIEGLVAVHATTVAHEEESFRTFVAFMAPFLDQARSAHRLRPGLSNEDVTEWIIRTITSFALMGDARGRTRAERRSYLKRMLVPAFFAS